MPEGGSPRNWDVDFTIGGVGPRQGLYTAIQTPTPDSVNFLYAKTFLQPSGQINTLVQDQNGVIWAEDVTNNPGTLTSVYSLVNPGMYMQSSTNTNREYMCFSDLNDPTQQGDIPRQWAGPMGVSNFDRVSQCAPGQPPAFNATLSAGTVANITSWSITNNVCTFQAPNAFVAGEIVTITGLVAGSFMNTNTYTVSGVGLTGTQFEISVVNANASATETGMAIPQYSYPISTITQNPAQTNTGWASMTWSAGVGSSSSGSIITIYYARAYSGDTTNPDTALASAFASGYPVYVYVQGATFGNGTQLVLDVGSGQPPNGSNKWWYFTYAATGSGQQMLGSAQIPSNASYQITLATVNTSSPIPGLGVGDQIQINAAQQAGWDATWTIAQSLSGYTLQVLSTEVDSNVYTYYYSYVSGGSQPFQAPAPGTLVGQLVTVTGTLNGNGIFNLNDAPILNNGTDGQGNYFTIANAPVSSIPNALEPTAAVAVTSGSIFQIDPGQKNLGTANDPIFGNSSGGTATIVGGNASQFPITAGTRQGVVLFVTRNGAVTPASPPVTFNTTSLSNFILANNLPVGPPDTVIARVIAITEAGQNGVPGAYFYYIPNPVTTVINNASVTYSSFVIPDNTTTSVKLTFNDATLLNSTEIDIAGLDYFNTVELGNAGWCFPYANRMFYGLVQNKVYNFNNMSFDGGYLNPPSAFQAQISPSGWNVDVGSNPSSGNPVTITSFLISSNVVTFQCVNTLIEGQNIVIEDLSVGTYFNNQTLTVVNPTGTQFSASFQHADVSAVSDSGLAYPQVISGTVQPCVLGGLSYYIQNTTGTAQDQFAMITQSAYQDVYNVNILNPQVTYGVRVLCRCPSGVQTGNLVVDLTTSSTAEYAFGEGSPPYVGSPPHPEPQPVVYTTTYGTTYEGIAIPFKNMSTSFKYFNSGLLTNPFTYAVPASLLLRLWAQDIQNGGDCEVKRVEIYPLTQPIGFPQDAVGVIGSYINQPESFDINSGVIQCSKGNQQQAYGAAEFEGTMFILKENSILETVQTPGQEPGAWAVDKTTDDCGTCGIYAYDIGKQYLVTACRSGLYVFNGREPSCINWEIRDVWNAINWSAARTIWVKNDIVNSKIYVGVPLPTPNQWLPDAPVNASPMTPNVMLTLNYLGLPTYNDLAGEPGMHVTMFGALADIDMRRKWTIWNIPAPNAAFLVRPDIVDQPIFICNGRQTGKMYGFSPTQTTDDGTIIAWDYCTYGFVNPAKAATNPLLGFHRKRWTGMQVTAAGQGPLTINLFADDIVTPTDEYYVWNQPNLLAPTRDFVRNLNLAGNRVFIEFGQEASGSTANISKIILVGSMDVHAPMPRKPGLGN